MSVTELETIDDAQTTLRTDMAAGFRWLHKFGMSDIIGGSLVARVPRQLDWMLTHTYGRGFDEMRASDMVKVDHEANVIDNSGAFVNFAAVNPASWIFRARPMFTRFFTFTLLRQWQYPDWNAASLWSRHRRTCSTNGSRTWMRTCISRITTARRSSMRSARKAGG